MCTPRGQSQSPLWSPWLLQSTVSYLPQWWDRAEPFSKEGGTGLELWCGRGWAALCLNQSSSAFLGFTGLESELREGRVVLASFILHYLQCLEVGRLEMCTGPERYWYTGSTEETAGASSNVEKTSLFPLESALTPGAQSLTPPSGQNGGKSQPLGLTKCWPELPRKIHTEKYWKVLLALPTPMSQDVLAVWATWSNRFGVCPLPPTRCYRKAKIIRRLC